MNGREYWTLNKSDGNKLLIFEHKILRKIFWTVNEKAHGDHVIIMKCLKRCSQSDIVKIIKNYRIRWLGHLYRTDGSNTSNTIKNLTFIDPTGARKWERLTTRRLDSIKQDINKI